MPHPAILCFPWPIVVILRCSRHGVIRSKYMVGRPPSQYLLKWSFLGNPYKPEFGHLGFHLFAFTMHLYEKTRFFLRWGWGHELLCPRDAGLEPSILGSKKISKKDRTYRFWVNKHFIPSRNCAGDVYFCPLKDQEKVIQVHLAASEWWHIKNVTQMKSSLGL